MGTFLRHIMTVLTIGGFKLKIYWEFYNDLDGQQDDILKRTVTDE